MSAFTVSDKHISALVNYPKNDGYYYWNNQPHYFNGTRGAIGQILVNENYRSVNARYDEQAQAPEFEYDSSSRRGDIYSAVQIIKACQCYAYQACETDDWESTEAYAIIETIKAEAIHRLPGYDTADWEIH